MQDELGQKLKRVRALLDEVGANAALIGGQPSFAWLACGNEAHVAIASERAAGALVVTPRELVLIASAIEMPRLRTEVLRGVRVRAIEHPWYEPLAFRRALASVVDPHRSLSDTGEAGTRPRPAAFRALRSPLLREEQARLRGVARDAEAAMRATCFGIRTGLRETDVAGVLASECFARQLTPVVLLVAADARIARFRHPIPTGRRVVRNVMVVLCARRHGLVVSLTRLVCFGKRTAAQRARHRAACEIDAELITATRGGTTVGAVLRHGIGVYGRLGYAREWTLHHQGGPCGYEPRDEVATPSSKTRVVAGQAFAWNPSITGTKSEDTILATEAMPEILTAASGQWPMVQIETAGGAIARPAVLEL